MGWVEDEYQNRRRDDIGSAPSQGEAQLESQEHRVWSELVRGLESDLGEFKSVGGEAAVQQTSDTECRVSNLRSGIAVNLHCELEDHTIRYDYDPISEKIAVPEGGVLTIRLSDHGADIYSADERLTNEAARRLVLEPLLFPRAPLQGLEPTGT